MSKPLENYIIRIKSSIDQFDNEGVIREEDRDHIELMTRGSFTKKNGSYYISYKETQTIGFEGCTTTIKIAEDGSRVALLRFGRANSQLLIERDRRNLCHYETEVGPHSGCHRRRHRLQADREGRQRGVQLPAGCRRLPHRQPQHAGNDGTARQLTSHCFLPAAPAASGLRTQTRKDT